jgi:hypothetical protein
MDGLRGTDQGGLLTDLSLGPSHQGFDPVGRQKTLLHLLLHNETLVVHIV